MFNALKEKLSTNEDTLNSPQWEGTNNKVITRRLLLSGEKEKVDSVFSLCAYVTRCGKVTAATYRTRFSYQYHALTIDI